MAWSHALLHLDRPECEAVDHLVPGQQIRCINAGGRGSVLAHAQGGVELPGWSQAQCGGPEGYLVKESPCARCPVRSLPLDVLPVQVDVRPSGLDMRVACARPAALAEAYHHLRRSGQGPHVRRSGRLRAKAPTRAVDLSVLTTRQTEALRCAVEIGYFDPARPVGVDELGAALGCSRSTAHEHLRRGLARLLGEVFS